MYIVTDETEKNASSLAAIAQALEPCFWEWAGTMRQEERLGIDAKIFTRWIAKSARVKKDGALALMFAAYCRGFIDGTACYKAREADPKKAQHADEALGLVELLLSLNGEQFNDFKVACSGRVSSEIDTLLDAIERKRGSI